MILIGKGSSHSIYHRPYCDVPVYNTRFHFIRLINLADNNERLAERAMFVYRATKFDKTNFLAFKRIFFRNTRRISALY